MAERHEYAVSWREGDDPALVGRLRLTPRQVRIEGRAPNAHESSRVLSYGEIEGVEDRRVDRNRVVELAVSGGRRIVIASLDRAGSLGELAGELRSRAVNPHGGSGVAPMTVGA